MTSDLPPQKLNRQILDEASAWFVDFRIGDVDQHTQENFYQWLRQSPQHIRAYLEIATTYVELPSKIGRHVRDIDLLIARARAETSLVPFDSNIPNPVTRAPWLARRALLVALASVMVVSAALLSWFAFRPETYSTQRGEHMSIALSDGSTIDLNANSEVTIEFSKAQRDVELQKGQALFEVAKDKARPFVVHSGTALVRAVGTQFDVYQKLGGTTVTVVEGRVAVLLGSAQTTRRTNDTAVVATSAGATFVSAGQSVVVSGRAVTAPHPVDVVAATAWLQRRLIFDASPLGDVVEEFNRVGGRRLIIEDATLKNFSISGIYSSSDPASFIRFLQAQPEIRVIETDSEIKITRR